MPTLVARLRWLLLAPLLFSGTAQPAAGADLGERLSAESGRLQQLLESKAADPDWKDARPEIEKSLGRALAAASGGRDYLALEELGRARLQFQVVDAVQRSQAAIGQGLPGFEAEWKRASLDLAAAELEAGSHAWSAEPAVIRALAEAAQGRTLTLLEAARAFAPVTDAKAGVYYLGQARASADFAEFCRRLSAKRKGAPASLPAVLPALRELQDRTLAAFQPPRSIDRHPEFIQLNATLKFAGELDAAGLQAGAWYKYLEAMLQFGRISEPAGASPDEARQAGVRAKLRDLRQRMADSTRDDSLAELFLQRAEALVAAAPATAAGAAPSAEDWQTAAILVEQVLPAYFAAPPPAAGARIAAKDPLTVTLVRWPYT